MVAGFSSHAQQVKVSGKVTDSLQNPLTYINVYSYKKTGNLISL